MPVKMAGSEMIRIEALTVAVNMPRVVLDSTDQRYGMRGVAGRVGWWSGWP
jgi:hypothetical protein